MRSLSLGLLLEGLICLIFLPGHVSAQQVTVSTPYHSVSDSFFENMGVNWGLSGPNWSFSFGGSPFQAAPPFGGFDPSAGANLGYAWRSGGFGGFFNGNWSQGSRRSFVSQVPSVTLTNGVPGWVADTSVSPFVISYVPIVGAYPGVSFPQVVPPSMMASPGASGVGRDAVVGALQQARAEREQRERLQDATHAEAAAARMNPPAQPNVPGGTGGLSNRALLGKPAVPPSDEPSRKLAGARASSAGRPAPSVAEARRMHAAEEAAENEKVLKYIELGRNAEATGKPNVARYYYETAARQASGELREDILARLESLTAPLEGRQ
jgi:hypothetical protein